MELAHGLAERLILGKGTGKLRRYTQDSPVLPDVWLAYAANPEQRIELLLTPYLEVRPGELSRTLRTRLGVSGAPAGVRAERPSVVYNQSVVLARLGFDELVLAVLPLSEWWFKRIIGRGDRDVVQTLKKLAARDDVGTILDPDSPSGDAGENGIDADFLWMVRLIGTIEYCRQDRLRKVQKGSREGKPLSEPKEIRKHAKQIVQALTNLLASYQPSATGKPEVYSVNRNRPVEPAILHSTKTVKADAAGRLFNSSCKDLTWAIIDGGIDGGHKGFCCNPEGDECPADPSQGKGQSKDRTRVIATYDFTLISALLDPDELSSGSLPPEFQKRMGQDKERMKEASELIQDLRQSLDRGREIDWHLYEPLLRIRPKDDSYIPKQDHGTHVAGILAAHWPKEDGDNPEDQTIRGVCPDIKLYDLRVLDRDGNGDEFSVMAALQFVRHLNAHKEVMVIHGVNLSLSIQHKVANYACGRTPVCDECDRVVAAGVVVVAAAGNRGHQESRMPDGSDEGYRSISITDPGNARRVITVGATHVSEPHTYGVSYFSSRGPTGDGRLKPDLVAPGEKICSLIPDNGLKTLDGTSMAAPHVSGAAALLMARHPELIGDPERVKHILCQTATDLGRERYFQGAGLVDILRAIQSV